MELVLKSSPGKFQTRYRIIELNVAPEKRGNIYIILITFVLSSTDENWKP